jgi:acyl carrier protein
MPRIHDLIIDLILLRFDVPDARALDENASLLDRGIVDARRVMDLTASLEKEFGIRVTDSEIVPENLDSVARIATFVARKLQAAA